MDLGGRAGRFKFLIRDRGGGDSAQQAVVADLVAVRPSTVSASITASAPRSPACTCRSPAASPPVLRRLPSHRGATRLRATLTDAEWRWYEIGSVVAEWAFCLALTDGAVRLPGSVDFLIWSATARRISVLAPEIPG